jgi:hypothetical protein
LVNLAMQSSKFKMQTRRDSQPWSDNRCVFIPSRQEHRVCMLHLEL